MKIPIPLIRLAGDRHRSPRPHVSLGARQCEVPRCHRNTSQRKPWCEPHIVEHSPYAQRVSREWSRRTDTARVGSLLFEDATKSLRTFGAMTVVRLARELNIEIALAKSVAISLVRQRIARKTFSSRAGDGLELTGDGSGLRG